MDRVMNPNDGDIYDTLLRRLDDAGSGKILTLPDGSVDIYYDVCGVKENPSETRDEFVDCLTDTGTNSCHLREIERTMGGQSVNTAKQCSALGDDVSVFSHTDDPIFDDLNATTYSMGEPARVNVLVFEDEELLLPQIPAHYSDWTLADLLALPDAREALNEADVVCIQNWVSFDSMDSALRDLADEKIGSTDIVFDPGDITKRGKSDLVAMMDAIRYTAAEYDVLLSLNRDEMEHLLDVAEVSGYGKKERIQKLCSKLRLRAAIMHHEERALAATETEELSVPNISTEHERRKTGAGDRFNGGVAHAMAVGWDLKYALLLGNACASYYVENKETGTPESLSSFLSKRSSSS